ncbi:helix-turn-helix domain-containing protein [Kitasatospora purpeofusca]|uniref:helix-turn-helix domain-containing protein n=1 Tax=Kitasatospora purpeofusca TaxID=67352 RepID=UPI0037F2DBCF
MHLRYSCRICPTTGQRQALARTFGCARVVYNDALAARKQARRDGRPYPRGADLQKLVITGRRPRYGRHVGIIGRYAPTSQVCSTCGVLDGPKPLSVRTWTCGACGTCHDRDLNAARNILSAGRTDRMNARGGPVRPGVAIPRQAHPVETGTHRNAGRTGRKPRAAGAAGIPVLQRGENVNRPR